MFKRTLPLRDQFLQRAHAYVGYRTRPGGLSDFSQATGYHGHDIPWSGAWIDHVARETDVSLPACVYSPSALSEFVQTGRFHTRPEPGDIVFFAFPTVLPGPSSGFSMPHVGIVTARASETGKFMTVEAQVSPGLPRGTQDADGVFERTRWIFETIGFGRPSFQARPATVTAADVPLVHASNVRTGTGATDIGLVQTALRAATGLREYRPGIWDPPTRRAFARWQRQIGRVGVDATGLPEARDLERLGRETGVFRTS